MPLLIWWALEEFCTNDAAGVVDLFEDRRLFDTAMVQSTMLEFLMRRLAAEGTRDYLRQAARLLRLAPDATSKASLLLGFETAYRGRSMVGLPDELLDAIADAGGGSLAMQLRQGASDALANARTLLRDSSADELELQRVIEALGEVRQAAREPPRPHSNGVSSAVTHVGQRPPASS